MSGERKWDWKTWMGQAAEAVHSLLHVRRETCLQCKQSGNLQKAELGLCHACFARIPWIRQVICPICGRGEHCQDCVRRELTYFVGNRSSVRYDDSMKELLARYKYRGDERLKSVIGGMLIHPYRLLRAEGLGRPGTNRASANSVRELITFTPVSERRLHERGFNQAEQMAVELGRQVGVPVVSLLKRSRHTEKQSFKTRSERMEDLRHAFEVDEDQVGSIHLKQDSPLFIYIVDDVYTTGSTMNQCAEKLRKRFDAHIFGLTWAR